MCYVCVLQLTLCVYIHVCVYVNSMRQLLRYEQRTDGVLDRITGLLFDGGVWCLVGHFLGYFSCNRNGSVVLHCNSSGNESLLFIH